MQHQRRVYVKEYIEATFIILDKRVITISDSIAGNAKIISGMKGCENIYIENDSLTFYATDCSGMIYKIENDIIVNKVKIGSYALGSDKEWLKGQIFRIDPDLNKTVLLFGDYPGINGGLFDSNSKFYFASGKLSPFDSNGIIYRAEVNMNGDLEEPDVLISGLSSPNVLSRFKRGDLFQA